MAALAEQLRTLRTASHLTLREAGARAQVSASALSDIERGRRRPSLAVFEQLLAVYQMRLVIVPIAAEDTDRVPPLLRAGPLTAHEQSHLATLLDERLQLIALITRLLDGSGAEVGHHLHALQAALTPYRTATAAGWPTPDARTQQAEAPRGNQEAAPRIGELRFPALHEP